MRDLNEDCNSFSRPPCFGDKTLSNGQYYDGVSPRAVVDACQGYDKDILKQTMLEHEHIFKDQVYQLHRLYRVQRGMMDEMKMREGQKNHISAETSLSSSPLASQITFEDARKWNIPSSPLVSSVCARHSISGSSFQNGSFPSQNGASLKGLEVLHYRPAKVRRKMIDIQLPADEYIDTEEENRDATITSMSSLLQNGNGKVGFDNRPKSFLGDSGKSVSHIDLSTSKSSLGSSNSLIDLNEPGQVENTNDSVYVDLLGNGSSNRNNHDHDPSLDLQLLDFPNEISVNFHRSSIKMSTKNQCLEIEGRARGFLQHVLKAELGKSYLKSASQGSDPEKDHTDKARGPPTFLLADQNKVDLFRGKTVCDLDIYERSPESSSVNPGSVVTSGSINPWPHPDSYWGKPQGSLCQNSVWYQAHPFLSSGGSSSKSSAIPIPIQSNGVFGHEMQYQNGCRHGSSSESKEFSVHFTSTSYNHLHSGYSNGNSSDCTNMKVAKGMNLNIPLSDSSPYELSLRGLESGGGRKDENTAAGRDLHRVGFNLAESSVPQSDNNNNETSNSFIQMLSKKENSVSCSNNVEVSRNTKTRDCLSNKKFPGTPIFENNFVSEEHSSMSTSQPSGREAENISRNRLPDINMPCEDTVPVPIQDFSAEVVLVAEKEADTKVEIDLNLCITEEEEEEGSPFIASIPDLNVRMPRGIDLEALPEIEDAVSGEELLEKEHETSKQSSEVNGEGSLDKDAQSAAEAIVAISSSYGGQAFNCNGNTFETSSPDPLNWFAEVVSTFGEDIRNRFDGAVLRSRDVQELEEEIDYFEFMTLQLAETTEEDYMPKPLVPENFKIEEAVTTILTNRPRRGRQRRDFQRDIFPGLASLSRHEVTEDVQTFGGLMRATGHLWTRRNATRRRSITSPCPALTSPPINNNILEALDGWGKTPRRPRRQRCPAGNPPSIALT